MNIGQNVSQLAQCFHIPVHVHINACTSIIILILYPRCNYLIFDTLFMYMQCNNFIEKYGSEIIKLIVNHTDPETICSIIHLCTSSYANTQLKDTGVFVYLCLYVCIYLCLCLCVSVCVCVSVYRSMSVSLSVCIGLCLYFCVCVYRSLSVSLCLCVCISTGFHLEHSSREGKT